MLKTVVVEIVGDDHSPLCSDCSRRVDLRKCTGVVCASVTLALLRVLVYGHMKSAVLGLNSAVPGTRRDFTFSRCTAGSRIPRTHLDDHFALTSSLMLVLRRDQH